MNVNSLTRKTVLHYNKKINQMLITGNTANRNGTGEKEQKHKSFMERLTVSVTLPSSVRILILRYVNNNYTK